MSLFNDIKAAGIEYDHHEGDLYLRATKEADEILSRYPIHKKNAKRFVADDGSGVWIDVPFAYPCHSPRLYHGL